MAGVLAWTSIVLLAGYLFSSSTMALLYYLGLPFILFGVYANLSRKRLHLLNCDVKECQSTYEIESMTLCVCL